MLDDLDRTLAELLNRELPSLLGPGRELPVSFAAPDSDFPPTSVELPAIDLFLYDLRENGDLRSSEWQIEKADGRVSKRRPAVRLDCSYLVTAWASKDSPTPALDEHRLLGEVMKVLLRYPTLPEEVLQGSLKDQAPPLPTITLQPGRLQSLGEFWQALGGKPKVAFSYTVTIGVVSEEALEAGPLVLEKVLVIRPKDGEGPS